jgi:DmsE family decaheme c-type cytochrome
MSRVPCGGPWPCRNPKPATSAIPRSLPEMSLPSHHPIREGKMSCSDCHDPHGQREGNLNAESLNLTCYKCHADKQGPFAYEHPPVTENCNICHEPHGTVTNNLLKQPATFLCLRCHTGHRAGPAFRATVQHR